MKVLADTHALVGDPVPWWRKYVMDKGVFTLPIGAADVMALNSLSEIHRIRSIGFWLRSLCRKAFH